MLPPRGVRRAVLAPATVLLAIAVLVLLPVWLLLAAIISPLVPGRARVPRVLWVLSLHLALEAVLLPALLWLWLAAGFGRRLHTPTYQHRHYALVRWYLRVMFAQTTRVLRVTVRVEGPDPDEYLGRPLLVFSRHAGPGDSFLLAHALINWYGREPRIVIKETLQWDPALDILLNRLPNRFIATDPQRRAAGEDVASQVGALAASLDGDDAFVIFPEGGNFTERRRGRAIDRLRRRGLRDAARRAAAMRNVLPPQPGGVSAALDAAPGADVVWVAHTGVDHLVTVADVWRELPMDKTITMRWWRVPADEVPAGRDARLGWLYGWWERIDAWITDQRAHEPAERPPATARLATAARRRTAGQDGDPPEPPPAG